MGLMQIFAKVMFKRGAEAAGKKVAEAVDRRRKIRKGEIDATSVTEGNGRKDTSTEELTFLDKCLKYRFILVILFILGFACAIWAGSNADKYRATYQKVGEYHVKEYGEEPAEKKDYVRMYVVSAEPLMYLYSRTTSTGKYSTTTSSRTTLYDVYVVKDSADRVALYCDVTDNAFTVLVSGSSYGFENNVPCMVLGKLTSIHDEFKSYQDYKTYVTEEMEQLDMIMEGNPPDGVYDYVQSDEDCQEEEKWNTVKTVAKDVMYVCIALLVVLFIINRVRSNRGKPEQEPDQY